MEHTNIGSNIRQLRLARGYTQEQLAEAAGLSLAGFRNYEAGRVLPRVDALIAIARELDARLDELVSETKTLKHVRFRATKRLNTRDAILSDVARWLEDFTELEEMTGDKCDWKLRNVETSEPKEMAKQAREYMKISAEEPIRDICGLLEKHGVKVFPWSVKSEYFFGLSVGKEDGGPAVVVNNWDRIPVERWIFSAAHELGHLLMHIGSFNVKEEKENEQEEKEANLFASYLLMPEGQFRKEWDQTVGLPFVDRVLKVKRMFRVSYKTVLYRLHETGHQDVWPIFRSQYQRRYGKQLGLKDEPAPLGPDAFAENRASLEPKRLDEVDFVEDRLKRLVRTALLDGKITRDRAAEILRISPKKMLEHIEDWAA